MDGTHEYFLSAEQDLRKLCLFDWWKKYSGNVVDKGISNAFLNYFSRSALSSGNEELLQLMLEHGANVNYADDGECPLIFLTLSPICKTGFSSVRALKLIIAANANLNEVCKVGGLTPLMCAINSDAVAHAVILLNSGADPWFTSNVLSMNAVDYAKRLKKYNFINIMRECY